MNRFGLFVKPKSCGIARFDAAFYGAAMRLRALSALFLVAATPTQAIDLVKQTRSGHTPSFSQVLDARFGRSGRKDFDVFHAWATGALAPEDRARVVDADVPDANGKPRWKKKPGGCQYADLFGEARAMAVVIAASDTREAALFRWIEVQRVFASASALEQQNLRDARKVLAKQTTPTGRELALRVASDQAWREAQFTRPHDDVEQEAIGWKLRPRLCRIDHGDTAFLKTIIAREGWPTISRDGADAAADAWLLAQHADDNLDFQRQVLALLEPLFAKHEVDGKSYALLYDRVAHADSRPQRYGSQFTTTKAGCLAAMATADQAGVDARRKAVGLDTIAEYAKRLGEAYKQPVCAGIFTEER